MITEDDVEMAVRNYIKSVDLGKDPQITVNYPKLGYFSIVCYPLLGSSFEVGDLPTCLHFTFSKTKDEIRYYHSPSIHLPPIPILIKTTAQLLKLFPKYGFVFKDDYMPINVSLPELNKEKCNDYA